MPGFEDLARKCVRRFSPYVPGRPIEEIKERFGLNEVIKLASNENPLGPSPKAAKAIPSCLTDLNRYPEGGSTRLRGALAKKYRLDPTCVLVGAGSDEIIELLAKSFLDKSDEIVVSEHAFIRYKMAGDLMGCRVVEVPMAGFTHDLRAMRARVTKTTKIIFIANPNNPTGTYVTRKEFAAFIEAVPRNKLVVMDEAYFEYARHLNDYPDGLEFWRKGHRNIVVLRTFSKIFGLAGLRVGYALGDASVLGQVDRIRPPFNVTIPAQVACEAALGDSRHVKRAAESNRTNMAWLCSQLDKHGIEYVPSATNFVLIKTAIGGVPMFNALLAKGVIVRPMAEYGFPSHVRVTVGTKREMNIFWKNFRALERRS